jgi:hypothetical protein
MSNSIEILIKISSNAAYDIVHRVVTLNNIRRYIINFLIILENIEFPGVR